CEGSRGSDGCPLGWPEHLFSYGTVAQAESARPADLRQIQRPQSERPGSRVRRLAPVGLQDHQGGAEGGDRASSVGYVQPGQRRLTGLLPIALAATLFQTPSRPVSILPGSSRTF